MNFAAWAGADAEEAAEGAAHRAENIEPKDFHRTPRNILFSVILNRINRKSEARNTKLETTRIKYRASIAIRKNNSLATSTKKCRYGDAMRLITNN